MLKTFPVSRLNELIKDHYDALICFNSFEDRCTTIPSHVTQSNFSNCLIFTNRDIREQSENNLNVINQLFEGKSQIIEVTLSSPINVADKMEETIKSLAESCQMKRVFIDITTFTHETLLILLAILREKFSDIQVVCGYVNAKEYSPSSRLTLSISPLISLTFAINLNNFSLLVLVTNFRLVSSLNVNTNNKAS